MRGGRPLAVRLALMGSVALRSLVGKEASPDRLAAGIAAMAADKALKLQVAKEQERFSRFTGRRRFYRGGARASLIGRLSKRGIRQRLIAEQYQ